MDVHEAQILAHVHIRRRPPQRHDRPDGEYRDAGKADTIGVSLEPDHETPKVPPHHATVRRRDGRPRARRREHSIIAWNPALSRCPGQEYSVSSVLGNRLV